MIYKTKNSEKIQRILELAGEKAHPEDITEIKYITGEGEFYYFVDKYPLYYWHQFRPNLQAAIRIIEILQAQIWPPN